MFFGVLALLLIRNCWPTSIKLGLLMWLVEANADVVVLKRAAICERVSPLLTVYVPLALVVTCLFCWLS